MMKTYGSKLEAFRDATRLISEFPFITSAAAAMWNDGKFVASVKVNIRQDQIPPILMQSAVVTVEGEEIDTTPIAKAGTEEEIEAILAEMPHSTITIPERRMGCDRRRTPRDESVVITSEQRELMRKPQQVEREHEPQLEPIKPALKYGLITPAPKRKVAKRKPNAPENMTYTRNKREFRNNRYRPGVQSKSRAMWDKYDEMYITTGKVPTLDEVKKVTKQMKWNSVNSLSQYYNWKLFNDFK